VIALVCVAGMMLESVEVRGIGLGTAGVLFAGIITGSFSKPIDHATLDASPITGCSDACSSPRAAAFRTCAEWRSACTQAGYDSCSA